MLLIGIMMLLIGVGEDGTNSELFIASDAAAFISHTRKVHIASRMSYGACRVSRVA